MLRQMALVCPEKMCAFLSALLTTDKGAHAHAAVSPPSSTSTWPVIEAACGLAR